MLARPLRRLSGKAAISTAIRGGKRASLKGGRGGYHHIQDGVGA